VKLTTSDGVELEGWYRPSRNGASVMLLSGGGSNRMGPLRHARMLERHGYGVLVYDPRGSGNSEGAVNSCGWGWEKEAGHRDVERQSCHVCLLRSWVMKL